METTDIGELKASIDSLPLSWLVSPDEKPTFIYRPDQPVDTKTFTKTLLSEEVLAGFETVLADILEE